MNKHRKLKAFIATVFISYACSGAILAISSTLIKSANEIFPVFSWSLFTFIPNDFHDYALRIIAIDNENLNPTLYFQDAGHWFPETDSMSAYDSIQKLGTAVSAKDVKRIEEVRQFLEPIYLGEVKSVSYEIVERSFDPLDRWKYGKFNTVRSLGFFERLERQE